MKTKYCLLWVFFSFFSTLGQTSGFFECFANLPKEDTGLSTRVREYQKALSAHLPYEQRAILNAIKPHAAWLFPKENHGIETYDHYKYTMVISALAALVQCKSHHIKRILPSFRSMIEKEDQFFQAQFFQECSRAEKDEINALCDIKEHLSLHMDEVFKNDKLHVIAQHCFGLAPLSALQKEFVLPRYNTFFYRGWPVQKKKRMAQIYSALSLCQLSFFSAHRNIILGEKFDRDLGFCKNEEALDAILVKVESQISAFTTLADEQLSALQDAWNNFESAASCSFENKRKIFTRMAKIFALFSMKQIEKFCSDAVALASTGGQGTVAQAEKWAERLSDSAMALMNKHPYPMVYRTPDLQEKRTLEMRALLLDNLAFSEPHVAFLALPLASSFLGADCDASGPLIKAFAHLTPEHLALIERHPYPFIYRENVLTNESIPERSTEEKIQLFHMMADIGVARSGIVAAYKFLLFDQIDFPDFLMLLDVLKNLSEEAFASNIERIFEAKKSLLRPSLTSQDKIETIKLLLPLDSEKFDEILRLVRRNSFLGEKRWPQVKKLQEALSKTCL